MRGNTFPFVHVIIPTSCSFCEEKTVGVSDDEKWLGQWRIGPELSGIARDNSSKIAIKPSLEPSRLIDRHLSVIKEG